MELTLRQARKLTDKINQHIGTISLSTPNTINIWEVEPENAETVFESAVAEFHAKQEQVVKLELIRSSIREAIQVANRDVIDDLVRRRHTAITLNSYAHQTLLAGGDEISSGAALARKIAAARESASKTAYSAETLSFRVLTKAQRDQGEAQLRKSKLVVEKLDDAIAVANATTKIVLPEETATVLRDLNLL